MHAWGLMLCVAGLVLTRHRALAETFYDVGPRRPYFTVQEAIDALTSTLGNAPFTDAQTIRVHGYTYLAGFAVPRTLNPSSVYPLTIRAATPGSRSVIKGPCVIAQDAHDVIIDGLIFSDATSGCYLGPYHRNITIQNCRFLGTRSNNAAIHSKGIATGTHPYNGASGLVVQDNIFSNCNSSVYLYNTFETSVRRNVLSDSGGVYCGVYSRPTHIWNNTMLRGFITCEATASTVDILNNSIIAEGGTAVTALSGQRVLNNILVASGGSGLCLRATPALGLSNFNDLFPVADASLGDWGGALTQTLEAWQAASGRDGQSISANPEFVDAPAGDLRIWSTSPCFDAGLDLSYLGLVDDFERDERPAFTAYDIGADECEVWRISPRRLLAPILILR